MGSNSGLEESGVIQVSSKIMVAAIILVFFVIVFVLFVYLYATYWRRRLFLRNPTTQQSPAAAIRVEAGGGGLDAAILRTLPVVIFDPEKGEEGAECAVCLCELSKGDKACLLPKCNHGFHFECIEKWLLSHSTCPLCRNPVAGPSLESNPHHESLAEAEAPNFPTNVLFWGDHTQVISAAASADSVPAPPSPSSESRRLREDGVSLVIDIPAPSWEINISSSVSASPSPMATRLRSLTRLLSGNSRSSSSREKRTATTTTPCSPHPSCAVEIDSALPTPHSQER